MYSEQAALNEEFKREEDRPVDPQDIQAAPQWKCTTKVEPAQVNNQGQVKAQVSMDEQGYYTITGLRLSQKD